MYAFANCTNLERVYVITDNFCHLDGSYVFCTHSESSNFINKNIVFYFNMSMYETYINDINWQHYKDYMLIMVQNNQIIYKSDNNEVIQTTEKYSYVSNVYKNNLYGLIEIDPSDSSELEYDNSFKTLEKVFEYPKKLISIDIPSECEKISAYAFEGCTQLKNITLSNTLKEIGEYAFKNCESLTSFKLSNKVKLNEGVFAGCKNIKKFEGDSKYIKNNGKILIDSYKLLCVLPTDDSDTEGKIYKISEIDENIKELCKSCFHGCKNLMRVDMTPYITDIGDNAFEGCTNLREVHFSGEVPPTLGENAFGNVREDFKIFVPEESLERYYIEWAESDYKNYLYPMPADDAIICYSTSELSFTLGDVNQITNSAGTYYKISNIMEVPESYFASKDTITKVILGSGVTSLGEKAFEKCTSLNYIYLSDSISSLGNECFSECTGLEYIHIPKYSKSTFGDNIFYKCTNLKEFISYYKGYVSEDKMCYIDNNSLMFFAQGGLPEENKSYTIPTNITEINRSAFRGSSITNITLNSSVEIIGSNAFNDCKGLKSIDEWSGVKTISNSAFKDCEELTEISLPSDLNVIDDYAFSGCLKMQTKNNICNATQIGNNAFYDCKQLGSNATMKFEKITEINSYTFYNCESLKNVNINSNVKSIGSYAFENCTNLISVSCGTNPIFTTINNNAFCNCKSLKTFNLSQKLTSIGSSAFENCTEYTNDIILPGTVTFMGKNCFKGSGIKQFKLLDYCKLLTIPEGAFEECSNLNHINISTSRYLNLIGPRAFKKCINLCDNETDRGRLCLPNTITSIRGFAFQGCEKISDITLPIQLYNMGGACFDTSNNINIYIPPQLSTCPLFTKSTGAIDSSENPFYSAFDTNSGKTNYTIYIDSNIINYYKIHSHWSKFKNKMYLDEYMYITINLLNAYLDKEFIGNMSYNSLLGNNATIPDINEKYSVYLYNSVWDRFMNMPHSYRRDSTHTITFTIHKRYIVDFISGEDGTKDQPLESPKLNVSIPMKINNSNNARFRVIVSLPDKFVNALLNGENSYTYSPTSVMLSMNACMYNGEDWDNEISFYCNEEIPENTEQTITYVLLGGDVNEDKYYKNNTKNCIYVPGYKKDICPSVLQISKTHYFDSSSIDISCELSSIGWSTIATNISKGDTFSLLQPLDKIKSLIDILSLMNMEKLGSGAKVNIIPQEGEKFVTSNGYTFEVTDGRFIVIAN